MNTPHFKVLVPGIVAAAALALAGSAGAQTPAPAAPPAATSSPAVPMTGHHMGRSTKAAHQPDMKKECQAMMAGTKMQEKLQAMRHAGQAGGGDECLQGIQRGRREAHQADGGRIRTCSSPSASHSRSTMMEMQHGSMAHTAHHMQMHGTRGPMECPMMKPGQAPDPRQREGRDVSVTAAGTSIEARRPARFGFLNACADVSESTEPGGTGAPADRRGEATAPGDVRRRGAVRRDSPAPSRRSRTQSARRRRRHIPRRVPGRQTAP